MVCYDSPQPKRGTLAMPLILEPLLLETPNYSPNKQTLFAQKSKGYIKGG